MAVEGDEVEMVRVSLREYLELARIGINRQAGVLGYPSATLLFAFIDAVGSYHRGNASFGVRVGGSDLGISTPEHHMRILNSEYFLLNLTSEQINRLYRLTRSPLTHNGLVGAGVVLWPGEPGGAAIEEIGGVIHIRLAGLLTCCEEACERFLAVAHLIVPQSEAVRELREKEDSYEHQIKKAAAALSKLGPLETMQATAMGRNLDRLKWRR